MSFTPATPDFEQMVKERLSGNHFTNHIGFTMEKIAPGMTEGYLDLQEHHLQQMNFVHGGVSATLADVVMGFAAYTLVKRGQGVVTVELKMSYLNPAVGDKLFVKGYVIKAGQRLVFCEAELWTMQNGKPFITAKSSSTMAVVNPEDIKR